MLEAAFIITVSSFIALLAAFFISVMMAVGWRDKYLAACDAANRNAGYWAESESKLYDAVIELAKQEVLAHAEGKRANELSRIAKDALQIAHHKEFNRCECSPGVFCPLHIPRRDPSETYTVEQFENRERVATSILGPLDEEWPEVFD